MKLWEWIFECLDKNQQEDFTIENPTPEATLSTRDDELGVYLPSSVWRDIMHLMREQMALLPEDSRARKQFYATVSLFERRLRDEVGCDDYPLFATCPYTKECLGGCGQAESCTICSLRSEVEKP